MAKSYTPGSEADAIVDRQLARGHYDSADEVVRAGLELLRKHDAEVAELLQLGDARIAAGRMQRDAGGDETTADGVAWRSDPIKDR
jgi:putative addiction module CopG family antidote